jgi:hypothetical protein
MATFAIDESSTFMNVASATAMVARTSWPPFNGGGGGWEGAGDAAGAVLMGYPDEAAARCNVAADCANKKAAVCQRSKNFADHAAAFIQLAIRLSRFQIVLI